MEVDVNMAFLPASYCLCLPKYSHTDTHIDTYILVYLDIYLYLYNMIENIVQIDINIYTYTYIEFTSAHAQFLYSCNVFTNSNIYIIKESQMLIIQQPRRPSKKNVGTCRFKHPQISFWQTSCKTKPKNRKWTNSTKGPSASEAKLHAGNSRAPKIYPKDQRFKPSNGRELNLYFEGGGKLKIASFEGSGYLGYPCF